MGEITWQGATIVWARVAETPDLADEDLAAMGERQLARYRELSGERAAGFLAGRALIRDLILGLGGGPDVALDSECPWCGADHAAPRTPGFALSVSHAADLVVVAIAAGTTALGVDVEQDAAAGRLLELRPLFPSADPPDLAGWTRIEAVIKADGRGVRIDPEEVRLQPDPAPAPGRTERQAWSASVPGRMSPFQVVTLPGPPGYVLSVARG